MSDKDNQNRPVSRIIRDRAMAILRDTRSKIDPALLETMKARLSPAAMGIAPVSKTAPPAAGDLAEPVAVSGATEPVDKQKIATIVLEYMKNREDKQKH